jgi:hypothetical protein
LISVKNIYVRNSSASAIYKLKNQSNYRIGSCSQNTISCSCDYTYKRSTVRRPRDKLDATISVRNSSRKFFRKCRLISFLRFFVTMSKSKLPKVNMSKNISNVEFTRPLHTAPVGARFPFLTSPLGANFDPQRRGCPLGVIFPPRGEVIPLFTPPFF